MNTNYEYKAFISYKHDDDKGVAQQIQRFLETFTPPKKLRPKNFKKWKICLDKTDFNAAKPVNTEIYHKILKSEFLIALYSDNYPKSKFCSNEINFYKKRNFDNSYKGIVPCIISGDAKEVLPKELYDNNWIACDFSKCSFPVKKRVIKNECLRIAASLLDCEFNKLNDRVKRRRKQRALSVIISALFLFIVLACLLGNIFSLDNNLQTENTLNVVEDSLKKYNSGDILSAVTMLTDEISSIKDSDKIPDNALHLLSEEIGAFSPSFKKHISTLSHEHPVSYVTHTCMGQTILTRDENAFYLWRKDGYLVAKLSASKDTKLSFGAASPEDAHIFLLIENHEIKTIDAFTGEIIANSADTDDYLAAPSYADTTSLSSQYNNTYVVSTPPSVDVFVYTIASPNEDFIPLSFEFSPISNFTFSPSGEYALFTNSDKAYLYNTFTENTQFFKELPNASHACFVSDNKICLQSSTATSVYDLPGKKELFSYQGKANSIPSVFNENIYFVSESGALIYSRNNAFIEWVPEFFTNNPDSYITKFKVSSTGKIIAEIMQHSKENETTYVFYDPNESQMALTLPKQKEENTDLIWISDNYAGILFYNSLQNDSFRMPKLMIYDIYTTRPVKHFNSSIPIQKLLFVDNKNTLTVFSSDAKLHKIDLSDYSIIDSLELNTTFDSVSYEYFPSENLLMLKLDSTAYFINTETLSLKYKVEGYLDANTAQNIVAVSLEDETGIFPLYTPQELLRKANIYTQTEP
ncbi:MAG: toll/interleukin-1 receptor domain-containing protein [Clostridia bacterium]|nr:toll/interleukin-1 receptor domain-containing protein [Clostridia bacterium]